MRTNVSRTAASWLGLGFVLVVVLLFATLFFGPIRIFAKPVTLPQLFPELAKLSETTTLGVAIGWLGLSPLSPIDAVYSLALHGDQFEAEGKFTVKGASTTRAVTVPAAIVRAFLAAALKVAVVEKGYTARIEHTDDYPSLSVLVPAKRGVLKIWTQSQSRKPTHGTYADRTPWGVTYADRTFVVTANDLDQAFDPWVSHLQYGETIDELVKDLRNRDPKK